MPSDRSSMEMERRLEFEGRSVEDALERARIDLGRRPAENEYEVLEDGKKGFLGIGGRKARIRVVEPGLSEQNPRTGGRGDPLGPDTSRGPSDAVEPGAEEGYSHQEAVRAVAGRILREMKLDLTARLRLREEAIVLELGGQDGHLLLENDGEGLEALQHVVNKILTRDPRFGMRVVVDSEGFRARRDTDLVDRARRAAEEVRRTGRPEHLEGLNPYERRLVHLALADEKDLRTRSTEDPAGRRLIIERLDPPASSVDE